MLVCIFQHHGSHMGKWRNVRPPKPFWLEAHPRNRYTEWVTMWASPQSQMSWLNKSHLTIVKKTTWFTFFISHEFQDCFHQYACHHTTSSIVSTNMPAITPHHPYQSDPFLEICANLFTSAAHLSIFSWSHFLGALQNGNGLVSDAVDLYQQS
jgi:hypothetical protein